MISNIPPHITITPAAMDEQERQRGYPALQLTIGSSVDILPGLMRLGANYGLIISIDEEGDGQPALLRIMPFLTDVQGMVQFAYAVGCALDREVWSKQIKG